MAFMLCANWRFCNMDSPLWSSIVREKYGCDADLIPYVNTNKLRSNFWRGLCASWGVFCKNTVCLLGDGYKVKF